MQAQKRGCLDHGSAATERYAMATWCGMKATLLLVNRCERRDGEALASNGRPADEAERPNFVPVELQTCSDTGGEMRICARRPARSESRIRCWHRPTPSSFVWKARRLFPYRARAREGPPSPMLS